MSFPPRPPFGMPMMPGGFSFTPMGMNMNMNMNMNMMPMQMMPPVMHPLGISPVVSATQMRPVKKFVPQNIPKKPVEPKPPITTVFVGNISDRTPDMMIKQMLQRCGNVLSWKRVQGASGKLQAFGFCEYEFPEATLRCIRLLNEWLIADKKLVVKVDAKTQALLDEYRTKKKEKEKGVSVEQTKTNKDVEKSIVKDDTEDIKGDNKSIETDKDIEGSVDKNTEDAKSKCENGEHVDKEDGEESPVERKEEELDENSKREDRVAQAGLEAIMKEYVFELSKEIPSPKSNFEKDTLPVMQLKDIPNYMVEPRKVNIGNMDVGDDKRDIISREIRIFRDTYMKVNYTDLDRERDRRHRERLEEMKRQREEEMERYREREHEREKERGRLREEREKNRDRGVDRDRSRSRSRSSSRGQGKVRSPSNSVASRDRRKEQEQEEEEEAYERRKLEKKMREKEAAYQERLKNWEQRERKKCREYLKEKEREDDKKTEEMREGRRLKEFLEDYDDLRDDPKFYKGNPLLRRQKEREKEKEVDMRDRHREREEIEELKRKLAEQGYADPEAELARIEKVREERMQLRLKVMEEKKRSTQRASKRVFKSRSKVEVEMEEGDSTSNTVRPPTVNTPVVDEDPVPCHQAVTKNHTPSSDGDDAANDDVSGNSVITVIPSEEPVSQSKFTPAMTEESAKIVFGSLKLDNDDNTATGVEVNDDGSLNAITTSASTPTQDAAVSTPPIVLGATPIVMGGANAKRKKLTLGDVFNQDDDDELAESKKRKLVPLVYDEVKAAVVPAKKPSTAEEKRQRIKELIESIPTAKSELFSYPLDWSIVDKTLMDKRIKPWVTKKIVEYIGEEEPTLTDFICQKVIAHSSPQSIQNDVAMVLDEEAEVFVVKMWRLLVYETEAKKRGLVK